MKKDHLPYQKEFIQARLQAFRSRLGFFCGFIILLYITVSALAYITDPTNFRPTEFITWGILLASAAVVLILNRAAKTLAAAKSNAAFFALAVIAALVVLFYVYPDYIVQSSEIFALVVFLISFLMPWSMLEVAGIGALAGIGYTAVFMHVLSIATEARSLIFSAGGFIDGCVFLACTVVICVIVRHRDERHERRNYTLMKELEERYDQMRRELSLARDVQRTLIPRSTSTDNATVAVSYVPMQAVGGDYATFHVTRDGSLFFLIGDVTGHGVPAALLVNRIYGEIEALAAKDPSPGLLMQKLNAFVQEHFQQTQMYFTVCSGLLDFKTMTLHYSNYGHPPQILRQHRDNRIQLLESQTYFLGLEAEASPRIFEGKIAFGHGDRIVLFTDGVIETKRADDEMYGMTRLESFIRGRSGDHPGMFNTDLLKELDAFRSGPVADDIFLVTIDIK